MGKDNVKVRYEKVKAWLIDQDQISINSIHKKFKVRRNVASAIFQQLKMDKFIQPVDESKDLWIASKKKLLDNKKGVWPSGLTKGVRLLLEKTEKSYYEWGKSYKYNIDSNPFENIFSINKSIQLLDPLQAFIYSCQLNFKTLILSDTLSQESLTLFLISKLSQIPVEKILVGSINDTEWPKLIMASAIVSDWTGAIETKYKDVPLDESEFMKLCKDPKYEVIIFDFKNGDVFISKAAMRLAKQNKKILVFPKLPTNLKIR